MQLYLHQFRSININTLVEQLSSWRPKDRKPSNKASESIRSSRSLLIGNSKHIVFSNRQWVNSEKIGWLVWRLAVIESRELACSIGVFSLKNIPQPSTNASHYQCSALTKIRWPQKDLQSKHCQLSRLSSALPRYQLQDSWRFSHVFLMFSSPKSAIFWDF